jgi:hypothetical protein
MVCPVQPKRCEHFRAVTVGIIVGCRLPGGDWLYEVPYRCPDCGTRFTEMVRQKTEREGVTLSSRIDAALDEVRRLRAMIGPKPAA